MLRNLSNVVHSASEHSGGAGQFREDAADVLRAERPGVMRQIVAENGVSAGSGGQGGKERVTLGCTQGTSLFSFLN